MKNLLQNILIGLFIIFTLASYFNYINKTTKESKNNVNTEEIQITSDKELEEYIVSVVACEMPALYEKEALKAQAVASRTYALYQRDINNVSLTKQDQCYNSTEELKAKWGSNYEQHLNTITSAVKETESIVMKLDNKLFKSFYFSTSNGYTEDSMTVFKEGNLKSVESMWDKENKNYEVKTYFEKEALTKLLGEFNDISITKTNATNHVLEVKIDNRIISGIEFRKLLNLRSTDFKISNINNTYEITTHGYGHGVGMSQFGANMLAKENKNYDEILKYYYGNIELKKY